MFCGNLLYHKTCFELPVGQSQKPFLIFMARSEQQGWCFNTDVSQDGQIGNNERLCAIASDHTVFRRELRWRDGEEDFCAKCMCVFFCFVSK